MQLQSYEIHQVVWPGISNKDECLFCSAQMIYASQYNLSPKKVGFRFTANLEALNGLKSKSERKQTPPKIKFYLLGGNF